MKTYMVRPYGKGFGVFGGRTRLFGRPKLIEEHERLFDAECRALHLVTQAYHKELDYERLSYQALSTNMMQPRTSEEHIYTALVLAGKRPPNANPDDEANYGAMVKRDYEPAVERILEAHLGTPISLIDRTMFEERFMTWYGRENPEWVDPRREREYDVTRATYGRNRYGAIAGAAPVPLPKKKPLWPRIKYRLGAVFRNFGEHREESFTDMNAAGRVEVEGR